MIAPDDNEKNTIHTKWIVSITIALLFFIPYGIISHLPLDRYTLPFVFGEDSIPFLPWTFIIYLSAFIQAIYIIHLTPKKFLRKEELISFCMVLVALVIFFLIPIEYPRNLYPTTNLAINYFRIADSAGNCLPSLHVAVALFLTGCYCLIEKSRLRKYLMCVWTLAIIISVLTTKQHYLIDIAGGIILAIPFIFIMRKYLVAKLK